MKQKVQLLILEGDGIGPEIVNATQKVLDVVVKKCKLNLVYQKMDIGFIALKRYGTTFPNIVLQTAENSAGIILGPVSHNAYPSKEQGGVNPSGILRKKLNLFANIRPAKTIKGIAPLCNQNVDLVIVRENTEGFYSDRNMFLGRGEFMPTENVALSIRKISKEASLRIAKKGFELAMQRNKKVTVVHKANVLRLSDGLFLECTRAVAKEYPEVKYEERLIDSMAALLVREISKFDVVITTNMFGDILSDLATEIAGGLGLGTSLNVGEKYAMAQAQHGSAPDIAGKNRANPTSLIGSTAMLLRWIGKKNQLPEFASAANMINQALLKKLSNKATRTVDLGGKLSTIAFAEKIIEDIKHQ